MSAQIHGHRKVSYVCNQRGLPDHDRANALARAGYDVRVIDWCRSKTYIWSINGEMLYRYSCHGGRHGRWGTLIDACKTIVDILRERSDIYVFYGYHNLIFFISAILCRLRGGIVASMNDSKFEDYDRYILSDLAKVFLLFPYQYIVAATERAAMYVRYLGKSRVSLYRCAIDTDRVYARSRPAFESTSYKNRFFVMIARFERKKNHDTALTAYEDYASKSDFPRKLVLCGYGQLESSIKDRISRSEVLSKNVELRGYVDSENIPNVLGSSLGLILPSTEEQFGIVVTEALAAGVPVVISRVCGATELVVEGETGFIIEPFDSRRLAFAMRFMSSDHDGWISMSEKGRAAAQLADTSVFVRAIENIIDVGRINEIPK